MSEQPSAAEQIRHLYEDVEKGAASAAEELVRSEGFGELLARTTENAMALTRIAFSGMDLMVRNLRLAGRTDLIRIGRQLGRTEDKLERVLQEVERLQEQVARLEKSSNASGSRRRAQSSNGRSASARRSRARSS